MITVGITKVPQTSEYRVFWRRSGKSDEGKAYYTDDPEDAVLTLVDTVYRARDAGEDIGLVDSKFTTNLVSKHHPSFLLEETKSFLRGRYPEDPRFR